MGCVIMNPVMASDPNKAKKVPSCPKCGNRLRLRSDQIGTQVSCPKCQASFTVGRPRDQKPVKSTANSDSDIGGDDDAYEPERPLQRSTIVPEADISRGAARGGFDETDWSHPDELERESATVAPIAEEEYLKSAKARGLVRYFKKVPPPKWTYFSGVIGYPWRGPNIARWTAMSVGLAVSNVVWLQMLDAMGLLNGKLTNMAIQGVIIAMFAVAMMLLSLAISAASFQSALQDTSDGHDLPQDHTMPEWDQWIFVLLGVLSIVAASAAIGYPLSLAIGPIAFVISLLIFFPILMLSAMESDSMLVPFSPPVLRTLGSHFLGWITFYLLSTCLLAAGGVAFRYAFPEAPYLTVFLFGPVEATLMLLYARLLGRLAWRASDAPIVSIEVDEPPPPGEDFEEVRQNVGGDEDDEDANSGYRPGSTTRRKRRFRMQAEFPDDAASATFIPPPLPPPRIDS